MSLSDELLEELAGVARDAPAMLHLCDWNELGAALLELRALRASHAKVVEEVQDIEPKTIIVIDRSLLEAACRELRTWKVDKGGDDQVVVNLEAALSQPQAQPSPREVALENIAKAMFDAEAHIAPWGEIKAVWPDEYARWMDRARTAKRALSQASDGREG